MFDPEDDNGNNDQPHPDSLDFINYGPEVQGLSREQVSLMLSTVGSEVAKFLQGVDYSNDKEDFFKKAKINNRLN